MLWVFDVDGCLIDSLTGTSLRPGAGELLATLRQRGHRVVLWSAGGADYARQRAAIHGIDAHVDAFHDKAERDERRRYLVSAFAADLHGAVFVDDHPEDLPIDAEVIEVSPYLSHNPHDRALAVVRERAVNRS